MSANFCPRAVLVCCVLYGSVLAQQTALPSSLSNDTDAPAEQTQSLGDVARRVRKDTTAEVKMTDEDTKKLFSAVDKIFAFASEDSGFPKHSSVKRQLVSRTEVEKYMKDQMQKAEYVQRFGRSELTMKKFGLLPRNFNLQEFLVKASGQDVAGYYDEDTKSISLLNWVAPDRQEPILAHELTHALQDQNYTLKTWMLRDQPEASNKKEGATADDNDEKQTARKAVVEGQAMVVYIDYLLAPYGRNLKDMPGLIYQMEDPAVKATIDSQMMHDAPMILREAGTFPYREGLIFEAELLGNGGRQMAFAGVFARPPRNSHEVLQPRAYIEREKLASVRIPDVKEVLGNEYDMYDSGGFGELDVRALLRQYGTRRVADDLSTAWQGGAYVTLRRTTKTPAAQPTTGDLALLYVSHWKTPETAAHFAHFYASAVSQRYQKAAVQPAQSCAGTHCPVSSVQVSTEEGPVIIEQWADNTVLVSESFDQATAAKLRNVVLNGNEVHAGNQQPDELSLRLSDVPAFSAFQAAIGRRVLAEIEKRAQD